MCSASDARRFVPLACCLLTATAFAQTSQPAADSAVADEEVYVLPAFTVSTQSEDRYRSADAISAVRVRAPLIDTPSSISVLTRDMMDDVAPGRIFDVARYVAGVQEGRGIQFQDRMIIRGFETQNGARTVDNFLQSADADNIEESVIERLEVAKGPNAILSPAGAPGGSINVVTKSPLFRTQRTFTTQFGLYDAQKATLDVSAPFGPNDSMAYRLIGSYQDSRRYWSSDAKIKGKALAPMLSWKVSDRTLFSVKFIGAEHWIFREPLLILDPKVTAQTDSPYLAPGIGRKSLNGIQPWSHVGTRSADLFTTLTTSFNKHISFRFAANGRYYYEDSDQQFLGTPGLNNRYNPYTGELTQDYTWALTTPSLAHDSASNPYIATLSPFFNPHAIPARGDKQWTTRRTGNIQADTVANYIFGAVSSQTVAGAALSYQEADTRNKNTPNGSILIDLANPTASVYPSYPEALSYRNGSSYRNRQLYLNQRFGFFDDRLYVTGGLLNYGTLTKTWNALTGAPTGRLEDDKTMWSASALFKVRKNFSLYYSHSTNSSPVIANNAPLWRDGVQDEAGFKTEFFSQKLSFNGNWFKIDQTNVTVPNPARQTDPTAPEQLVSDLGNDGFEFELAGSLTPNLSAMASYAHLKMRDSLGRHVRGVADETASLMLNYRFADGSLKGLGLTLGVTHVGRRAGDVPINYTPLNVVGKTSFFLEPQTLASATVSYRWTRFISTRLNIDNLFDKKGYIAVAGGRVSGTGITTATGINFRLSTTIDF